MLTFGVNVYLDCKDFPRYFDVFLVMLLNDNYLLFIVLEMIPDKRCLI